MPLVNVGQPAPEFTLSDQNAKPHALNAYAGKPVVLYFYPKDDTSSCTAEACAFRDGLPQFSKVRAVVLGVSPDSVKSHAKFAAKYQLSFPLLADEPATDGTPPICARFGVWGEKSMYGKAYMGVIRTTYLIGPDGRVAQRWDNVKVKDHADEVLAALRALQNGTLIEAKPAALPRSAKKPAPKPAKTAKSATSKKPKTPASLSRTKKSTTKQARSRK